MPNGKIEKQVSFEARIRLKLQLSLPSEKNRGKQETVRNVKKDKKKIIVSLNTIEVEENLKRMKLQEDSHLKSPENANRRSKDIWCKKYFTFENVNTRSSIKNIENYFAVYEDFQKCVKQSRE